MHALRAICPAMLTLSLCIIPCLPCLAAPPDAPPAPPPAAPAAPAAPAETKAEDPAELDSATEINVKNADIAAIIRIFSKKTKRNYILDERVKGKVSIYLPGKVSDEEAIRILDSVLALKGFTAVPIGENLWKILAAKEAKQSTIPTLTEDSDATPSSTMVTRLLNLKFVGAEEAKGLIAPLISGDGLINAYAGTNSLIIIDSQDNIERLVKIIADLDVPFSNREMTLIPVKHADAVDLANKLSEILGISGKGDRSTGSADSAMDLIRARLRDSAAAAGVPPPPGSPPGSVRAMSDAGAALAGPPRSYEPKIIPDERTNSIIIVADEDTTARIQALVSQLDSKVDMSGKRFYVYRCKYANAEELAEALSGNVSGSSGTGSSLSSGRTNRSDSGFDDNLPGTGGLSRSSSSRGGSSINRTLGGSSTSRSLGQSRLGTQSGRSAGPVSLCDEITITADPATNSLIINADKTAYQKVLELLRELDIKRRQVLVEAMLLEVRVDNQAEFNTNFLVSAGGKDGGVLAKSDFNGDLTSLFSNPTQLSKFSVAAATSGTLTLPGDITIPTQSVLLTAARTNGNVNVLSAPTILATDNEQAEIVVGQNVPFLASTSTTEENLNNTFNQIERQDVGITMRLTPQISGEELVRLKIFTEVSNVIGVTDLGPTTTIRTSETSVIAKDSQMIVIGGLMADDTNDSETGVPFFKDIPLFGHLFRDRSEAYRRTNLLIFITPRVVRDQFDARDNTLVRRDQFQDEISQREIYPDRNEVLQNPDLDNVAESRPTEKKSMGTILAPQEERSSDSSDVLDDQVIDLTISPKSLKKEEASSKAQSQASAAKAFSAPKAMFSGARYIVAQVKQNKGELAELPFKLEADSTLAGFVLPQGSPPAAFDFFRTGQKYAYQSGGELDGLVITVLGIFPSAEEASQLFDNKRAAFYTLSPYELNNLGRAPWSRAE